MRARTPAALRPRLQPGPRLRLVLLIVAAVLLAVAVLGLVLHVVTVGDALLLGLVAATPYLLLAGPAAWLALLAARSWRGLAVATVVVSAGVVTQAGVYLSSTSTGDGQSLTVMTANLKLGAANAADVVRQVRGYHVDLLMLEELTPQEQSHLANAGLDALLPYHASRPGPTAQGTGVWSRYPLADPQFPPGFHFQMVAARVGVPGLSALPTVVALHVAGPSPQSSGWQEDMARLPTVLASLPRAAPVIVGGDFNATPDTAQFRRLLTGGYHDAAGQAGAGVTRTFPADRWFPPLIAIDHVLTRGAVATSVDTLQISGSDHRALLSSIAIGH